MKKTNIVERLFCLNMMRRLQMAVRIRSWIIPLSNMVFREKHNAVAVFFYRQLAAFKVNAPVEVPYRAGPLELPSAVFPTSCRLA
ncbi:MAG: hypothetical protein WCL08_10615 [Verrucomicrobiota bacterium]